MRKQSISLRLELFPRRRRVVIQGRDLESLLVDARVGPFVVASESIRVLKGNALRHRPGYRNSSP